MKTAGLVMLLGAAIITACFVERPSEVFECSTTADCSDSRQCQSGYCVVPNCPEDCTSCDEAAKTCAVDCTSTETCGGVMCPSGWSCTITCSGANACNNIECGNGSKCAITCSGLDACQDIQCKNACTCDVTCGTGECKPPSCPTVGGGMTQIQCTVDGTAGAACDSSRDAGCTKC